MLINNTTHELQKRRYNDRLCSKERGFLRDDTRKGKVLCGEGVGSRVKRFLKLDTVRNSF